MNMTVKNNNTNDFILNIFSLFSDEADSFLYKDLVLTLLFLRYLSDLWQDHFDNYQAKPGDNSELIEKHIEDNYFLLPKQSNFTYLLNECHEVGNRERIDKALRAIGDGNIDNLHDVYFNLDLPREKQYSNNILQQLIESFAAENLYLSSLEGIRNIFDLLIENFAKHTDDKTDTFFTPPEVSELISELVAPQMGDEIYDPACGTASLLIKCSKQIKERTDQFSQSALYGQEIIESTSALAKMNLFLHEEKNYHLECGDTIGNPYFIELDGSLKKFDVVVSNPPFLMEKWNYEVADNDRFDRFAYGVPPKTKGNFAFILHMLKTLKPETGRMAVVVPDSALYRGAGEGVIRKHLIEDNLLDAVIKLPKKIFYDTANSEIIMVFKKCKADTNVLFVDSSNDFSEIGNKNFITEESIQKIVETCRCREGVDTYAHLATYDEIVENKFNLNISRYVNSAGKNEKVDLMFIRKEREALQEQLTSLEVLMNQCLEKLGA